MLAEISDNILNVKRGVICQQVNCMLVMGSGLAKQIRDTYPIVFSEYKRVMERVSPPHRLGKCQIVTIKPGALFVANLFGQYKYGKGSCYTDYNALALALNGLAKWRQEHVEPSFPIYVPYNMGCGLAGGNWSTVAIMVESVLPDAIIVRYSQ